MDQSLSHDSPAEYPEYTELLNNKTMPQHRLTRATVMRRTGDCIYYA